MNRWTMLLALPALLVPEALSDPAANPSSAAPEPTARITAECEMIVLPQKAALALIPDLLDPAKIEAAYARLEEMVERHEASLEVHLVAKGQAKQTLRAEAVEEVRYATDFDPPDLPRFIPPQRMVEMLKLRPDSGITATAFETRNIGVALEVNATPAGDEFYDIMVTVSHTRLGGWYKHQAGRLPTGKMLMIEQPQFLASRNTGSMRLRSGERAVVGIHQPAGSKKMIDLFFLKLTAASTPAQK